MSISGTSAIAGIAAVGRAKLNGSKGSKADIISPKGAP
jgi:hypothetical protein